MANTIIGYGCSYGCLDSLDAYKHITSKFKIDKLDNAEIINHRFFSHGADLIYNSILSSLDDYLDKYDDIFVYIELSSIDRISSVLPTGIGDVVTESFNEVVLHKNISSYIQNIFKLKNVEFINANLTNPNYTQIDPSHFNNPSEFNLELLKQYHIEIRNNFVIFKEQLFRYIRDIISIQCFLKSRNVPYGMVTIFDVFGGYSYENGVLSSIYNTHNLYKSIKNGNTDGYLVGGVESYVENVVPEFKWMLDHIDFSKFYFYNKYNKQRGGIDDFALQNYGIHAYGMCEGMPKNITLHDYYKFRNQAPLSTPGYMSHTNNYIHYLFQLRALNKFLNINLSETIIAEIEEYVFNMERCVNIKTKHPFPDNLLYYTGHLGT